MTKNCEFKEFCREDIGTTDGDCAELSGDLDFECGCHRFAVRVQDKLRENLVERFEEEFQKGGTFTNRYYDILRRLAHIVRTHGKVD